MVTIKLGELRGIIEGLNEIMNEKLPIKTAYSFGKLARTIQKEFTLFEENRKRIIESYGKRDENGKLIEENGKYIFDDIEAFDEKYGELVNITAEINFNPISIEQMGNVNLTPSALAVLESFIGE